MLFERHIDRGTAAIRPDGHAQLVTPPTWYRQTALWVDLFDMLLLNPAAVRADGKSPVILTRVPFVSALPEEQKGLLKKVELSVI